MSVDTAPLRARSLPVISVLGLPRVRWETEIDVGAPFPIAKLDYPRLFTGGHARKVNTRFPFCAIKGSQQSDTDEVLSRLTPCDLEVSVLVRDRSTSAVSYCRAALKSRTDAYQFSSFQSFSAILMQTSYPFNRGLLYLN
jgi:hypothetical protein